MLTQLLDLPGFHVDHLTIDGQHITITASPEAPSAPCPTCGTHSSHIHSAYTRFLRDLPWGSRLLQLSLSLRRFRCRAQQCPRQTFVERLGDIAPAYARTTTRFHQRQQRLGLALGGESGARNLPQVGLGTSPDTILRRIRSAPLPSAPPPRVVGVDDWAKRKGHSYGTIMIDLETRRPIDLLADRSADSLAAWLREHPTIEVLSRDRADDYITGATKGAPQAQQIADRWHLIKNLGDALQRMLERHRADLRTAAKQLTAALAPVPPELSPDVAPVLPAEMPHPQVPTHRQAQFAEVKQLQAQGWSMRQIGRKLGIDRRTVRRYLNAESVPVRMLPQNTSQAAPYLPDIQALWQAGCRSYQQIWIELRAKGFQGSYSSIRRLLKHYCPEDRRRMVPDGRGPAQPSVRVRSARQAVWLLVRASDELKSEDLAYRDTLCAICPTAANGRDLAQRFLTMIRERQSDGLDGWLNDAERSGITELRNFARGLRRDYRAVLGALQEPWSNGPVEAHVHRLKLIKRGMYGRANFDLLRQRVLAQV
jgi:transposase